MREQVNLSKAMTQKAFGAFGETLLLRVPRKQKLTAIEPPSGSPSTPRKGF